MVSTTKTLAARLEEAAYEQRLADADRDLIELLEAAARALRERGA